MPPGVQAPSARPRKPPETREFRRWEGVNVRDSRTGIGDTEFSWLENFIPIGAAALQGLRAQAEPVYEYEPGIGRMWGVNLNGFPLLIAVGLDGSIQQITAAGNVVQIAPPGTVTALAYVAVWQNSPLLIIDPLFGYFTWNGGTLTHVDPNLGGTSLAVFQGRVWIAQDRNITFSAPNSYDDFSIAAGGGAATITDSAFQGDITVLVSALEQLWIIGASAIDAISNVQSTGVPPLVTTSFSITNIVSGAGSSLPQSAIGYLRALVFGAPYGVHALSGVTPQKISEKLDGLSKLVTGIGPFFDQPAAIAVLEDNLCLLFLVHYLGTEAQGIPREECPGSLLIGFVQGKWFFATQGPLQWITTLYVGGVAQCWGHDGTRVYQCFGADACVPVPYKVRSKLYDFGSAVTEKALLKVGVEVRSQIQPTCGCQAIVCFTTNNCPPVGPEPEPEPAVEAVSRMGPAGVPAGLA